MRQIIFRLSVIAIAAPMLAWSNVSVLAQTTQVVEGPSRPYAGPGETAKPRGPDPATYARFYVSAVSGAAGYYSDSGSSATWQVPTVTGYQFPSVRISISVAPQMLVADSDPSRGADAHFASDLTRLNAHVRATALDASGKPIAGTGSATTALMISPSESAFATSATTNVQGEARAAMDLALKHFGPVGGIASTFASAFHRHTAAGEIAYQSAANEFGWMWYQSTGAMIDGIHASAALFQVPASAASLRLSTDLISDWRRSGAWIKTYEITLLLTAAPQH